MCQKERHAVPKLEGVGVRSVAEELAMETHEFAMTGETVRVVAATLTVVEGVS